MEFLGDRIRYLRLRKELKQKDMAVRFSVCENTWSQYETNKRTPPLELIKQIAVYFSVSIDYLLSLTDVEYNPREEEFKTLTQIYTNLSLDRRKELLNSINREFI